MAGHRAFAAGSSSGHRSILSGSRTLLPAPSTHGRRPPLETVALLTSRIALQSATRSSVVAHGMQAVTDAEAAANEKRRQEAGNAGSSDEWSWTLNWDQIEDNIIVGSCPRSPSDVDRLVSEVGIDAILCLQSELCHEALEIRWDKIRDQAIARNVIITRVAVRDFDHGDQALMLPEAVRMLYLLLSMGRKVYVHCTAGINRATLTVVGYLTFVQGWQLDDAVNKVKTARPQAHPYIDCWRTVRARLTEGRTEELMGLAKATYRGRIAEGKPGSSQGDWAAAEALLIKETFQRQMGCALSLVSTLKEMQDAQMATITCLTHSDVELQRAELEEAADLLEKMQEVSDRERAQFEQVASELESAREEVAMLRQAAASEEKGDMLSELDALKSARTEIAALRTSILEVAKSTMTALEGESMVSVDAPSHPAAFLDPDPDAAAKVREIAANGIGGGGR